MGLPTALTLVGGLFSAYSSMAAASAQAAAAKAEAEMADSNANMAKMKADEALKAGAREEAKFRQQAGQFQASQSTALAASGVQMSGSALNVMADTAQGIEEDADMIRFNTLKNKWGFDVERVNFINQANAARAAAKNAKISGIIGTASSILSTGIDVINGLKVNKPTDARIGEVIKYGDYSDRTNYRRTGFMR